MPCFSHVVVVVLVSLTKCVFVCVRVDARMPLSLNCLGRRRKNNAVLVGEPGVGKTAIAEGIALRIVLGEVPKTLANKQIVELDMGMLVAGVPLCAPHLPCVCWRMGA